METCVWRQPNGAAGATGTATRGRRAGCRRRNSPCHGLHPPKPHSDPFLGPLGAGASPGGRSRAGPRSTPVPSSTTGTRGWGRGEMGMGTEHPPQPPPASPPLLIILFLNQGIRINTSLLMLR